MRRLLLLLVLLPGCSRQRAHPISDDYTAAERLLKKGELKEAQARASDGLKGCGSSAEWCWKFRLLEAETLLANRQNQAALKLLDVPDKPPNRELEAMRLMHLGQAWFLLQKNTRAEKLWGEALELGQASGPPLLVAEVELRQGGLLIMTARFDEAEPKLRRALETAVRGNDPYLQASAMANLGLLLTNTFRLDAAVYWLQRAYDLFLQLGASSAVARTAGNLGHCYVRLGDTEKALADFEEAAARFAAAGNLCSEQIWLGDIGEVFLDAKEFPAARERTEQALKMAKGCSDKYYSTIWLNNLAQASIESGELDDAERFNADALALSREDDDKSKEKGDKSEELHNRVNSAVIAAGRKQFDRAEELFRSVIHSVSENPTWALEAHGGLAELFAQQAGKAEKADAEFRSAIATVELRQASLMKADHKLSFLSSLVRFYQSYIDFLVERGAVNRALEVAESSRARILTAGTEKETRAAAVPHGLNAAAFQALARSSHHIFLSYWLAPKQSYVWVITPAEIRIINLPPEKKIRALVESYRTAIENLRDPLEPPHPAGEQLSQMLLGKIRELVPAGSRVTIVPDGALHSLNFETLPAAGNPSKYWIEDVTLSVAPSLGLLLNSRAGKKPQPSLLAFADPESPEEYPRLPYAGKEVETIAALFSPSNRLVYQRGASRPSAYRNADLGRFSLVHFAAHATANRASPLDSALILSREGNAYTLTAREIMNIRLNADLVTLSACRSAGARAYSGEGLVGLTWAFLQAGARRVIAGLWDVNDESTSILMSRLYREVTRGVPAEDALRTAKLSLLHGNYPYRKPYYWGPFQLYTGTAK